MSIPNTGIGPGLAPPFPTPGQEGEEQSVSSPPPPPPLQRTSSNVSTWSSDSSGSLENETEFVENNNPSSVSSTSDSDYHQELKSLYDKWSKYQVYVDIFEQIMSEFKKDRFPTLLQPILTLCKLLFIYEKVNNQINATRTNSQTSSKHIEDLVSKLDNDIKEKTNHFMDKINMVDSTNGLGGSFLLQVSSSLPGLVHMISSLLCSKLQIINPHLSEISDEISSDNTNNKLDKIIFGSSIAGERFIILYNFLWESGNLSQLVTSTSLNDETINLDNLFSSDNKVLECLSKLYDDNKEKGTIAETDISSDGTEADFSEELTEYEPRGNNGDGEMQNVTPPGLPTFGKGGKSKKRQTKKTKNLKRKDTQKKQNKKTK